MRIKVWRRDGAHVWTIVDFAFVAGQLLGAGYINQVWAPGGGSLDLVPTSVLVLGACNDLFLRLHDGVLYLDTRSDIEDVESMPLGMASRLQRIVDAIDHMAADRALFSECSIVGAINA